MSARTHQTLRRWAYSAGFIESELGTAASRMHATIRAEVLADLARLFDDRDRALPDSGSLTAAETAALIRQHADEQPGKASPAGAEATQPADFFQPDHTYQRGRWQFRCLAVALYPGTNETQAVGYLTRTDGTCTTTALDLDDWTDGGWTEATGAEGGAQ